MAGSPLALSYPELFRVTGPLLSLVFRTEDVWQRYNQFRKRFGALNQGFPFSFSGELCTLHAGVMLCIVFVTMLPDRVDDSFTSTICLYLSPSQLCLIKRMSNFKVTYLNLVDS